MIIYTDHRPLQWLFNLKEPNSKLEPWRLLQRNTTIKLLKEKANKIQLLTLYTNNNTKDMSHLEKTLTMTIPNRTPT